MQARWLTLFVLLASFTLLLALATGGATPAVAQKPQPTPLPPPREPGAPGEPYQDANGLWVMPASPRTPAQAKAPKATGGPDQFGYTWDDSVSFSWIDATGGTNTGLNGKYQQVNIPLPFNFKFYENTYNQIYISTNGTLGFNNLLYQRGQQTLIPSPATPNDVIAPYWAPLDASTGGVYYLQGGTAPDRWIVVEWYQVRDYDPGSRLTFEAVLYENGNILFQYLTLTYGSAWWALSIGIEDSQGLDGLLYSNSRPTNGKAVRFYRPAPAARVSVNPQSAGRFTTAGATEAFQFQVRNIGELGADTYDLTPSSAWSAALYDASGTTLLTDTDSDGMVDTGPLAQGATFTVTAKINVPGSAVIGNSNTATVTVRSSLDPTKQRTTTMQLAVPTHFAQVYRDDANGAMSLYLVQPNNQNLKKVTADGYYGYNLAVAEMPSSFVYAWYKIRSLGSVYVGEIEYTILDRSGNTVRAVTKLTDHSGAAMNTYDYSPAVAVAPNGRIGLLWYRYLWNSGTSQFNYNIWFAILDAAGNVVLTPTNITNNSSWGTSSDLNVPRFYSPRITATGDNRFVLAWYREHQEAAGWVDDIYYAVRDNSGSEIKSITKLTNGTPGGDQHFNPSLAGLSNNRAFLGFQKANYTTNTSDIHYGVLDSSGNLIYGTTNLSGDGATVWNWISDVVHLSNGKTVVAWSTGSRKIRFAVLDASYNRIAGPTTLNNPSAPTGDNYVSVTADTAGRGILTWMDYDWNSRRNLYYALVDGNGNVLTPPMVFRTSQSYIETSYGGYGNTSYHTPLFLPLILR